MPSVTLEEEPLRGGRHSRAVHRNYLVFYQLGPDTVEVLHILKGAQDYEAILFPES